MQRRRVSDEALRGVKLFRQERILTVPAEEAAANYVPAAAVIRRQQALFGVTGRKECVGALQVRCEISRLNWEGAPDTAGLECGRGERNSWCSGEMRRYQEEHRRCRRLSGPLLTLKHESVGSKQD